MKRLIMMLLAFAILLGGLSSNAFAQSSDPCSAWGTGIYPPIDHSIYFDCIPPPLFTFTGYTCKYKTKFCAPAGAPGEVGGGPPCCSNPISLSNGNTFIEETDI